MSNNTQIAIVLGAGATAQGKLTSLSRHRLDAGAQLWHTDEVQRLFVMGGHGQGWSLQVPLAERPQCDLRKEYLEACGVEANAILMGRGETRDTIGEAIVARRYFMDSCLHFNLVTSETHLSRALFIFQRFFGDRVQFQGRCVCDPEKGGMNPQEEIVYFATVREELLRLASPIEGYNTWEGWYLDHSRLYDQYRRIRSAYAATELRENEAYSVWYRDAQV